jgi:hypothetical protein
MSMPMPNSWASSAADRPACNSSTALALNSALHCRRVFFIGGLSGYPLVQESDTPHAVSGQDAKNVWILGSHDNRKMSDDIILTNGTRVQTDGTVTPVIGIRTKLKEGEAITEEGTVMKPMEKGIASASWDH